MSHTYVSIHPRFVEGVLYPANTPFTVSKKFDRMPADTKEVKGKSDEQIEKEAAALAESLASEAELDLHTTKAFIPDAELSPQQRAAITRKKNLEAKEIEAKKLEESKSASFLADDADEPTAL